MPVPARLPVGVWLDDLKLPIREACRTAAAWQLDAVGLDGLGPETNPRVLSATGRRELGRMVRSFGWSLTALRADPGGRRLADPRALDATLGRLREVFELARQTGARYVVLPLGLLPPATAAEDAPVRTGQGEALKALVNWGSEFGVRPALTPGGETPADLAGFLAEHDAGGLTGVDLDPGRLASRGVEPHAALSAFGPRVALATATDFYRGGGEAPFGKGDVAWGQLLIELSVLPGTEAVPLLAGCARECDRVQALRHAACRLKELRVNPLG